MQKKKCFFSKNTVFLWIMCKNISKNVIIFYWIWFLQLPKSDLTDIDSSTHFFVYSYLCVFFSRMKLESDVRAESLRIRACANLAELARTEPLVVKDLTKVFAKQREGNRCVKCFACCASSCRHMIRPSTITTKNSIYSNEFKAVNDLSFGVVANECFG